MGSETWTILLREDFGGAGYAGAASGGTAKPVEQQKAARAQEEIAEQGKKHEPTWANVGRLVAPLAGVAGVIAFVFQMIRRSKIFSSFMDAFLATLSVFIDIMMIPLIPVFSKVLQWLVGLLPAWTEFWSDPKQKIKDWFKDVLNIDLDKVIEDIKSIIKTALEIVKAVFSIVVKVSGVIEKMEAAWVTIKDKFYDLKFIAKEVWETIKDYAISTWLTIYNKAWKMWDDIKTYATEAWDWIRITAVMVWERIESFASSAWDTIVRFFISNVINPILSLLATAHIGSGPIKVEGQEQLGGDIWKTGLYLLHKGERVQPASEVRGNTSYNQSRNINISNMVFNIMGTNNSALPWQTARTISEEIKFSTLRI